MWIYTGSPSKQHRVSIYRKGEGTEQDNIINLGKKEKKRKKRKGFK